MRKSEKSYAGWYFLAVVIVLYVVVGLVKFDVIMPSLKFFLGIIKKIILVFVLVFALMALFNYFVSPKKLVKYFGKGGFKGYLTAIITGIISTGPIYMWYPLLNELQKQGVSNGLVACFLYNRAVKPALLPLIILYFGLTYTIVLTIVMIIFSVLQGIIVERWVR